jgi:hypothetical protein
MQITAFECQENSRLKHMRALRSAMTRSTRCFCFRKYMVRCTNHREYDDQGNRRVVEKRTTSVRRLPDLCTQSGCVACASQPTAGNAREYPDLCVARNRSLRGPTSVVRRSPGSTGECDRPSSPYCAHLAVLSRVYRPDQRRPSSAHTASACPCPRTRGLSARAVWG